LAVLNVQLGPGGFRSPGPGLTWRCYVSNTTMTTDVVVIDLAFSDAERQALAALLAGSRGLTRDAYA